MFNLTDNISTIELTGAPEQVILPVAYMWVWARNDGSETVYMSRSSTVSNGANGSISIPAGGAARLFVNGYTFYVNGSGTVLINATDTDSCPFRDAPTTSGGGAGGDYYTKIQSDTRYAQKSEIPTTLPANGGMADTVNGLIILNSENIALRTVEGYKKWVCAANTTPNTAGFITAGIWFKNNLEYSITAQIIVYATKKTPWIQAGYGTGTMNDMFLKGLGREWFANTTLETTPTPVSMIVPTGKTGYFGFSHTAGGQEAYINDVKAYTIKDVRLM
nr:MAG TPA: hypothetical protein [Caudoviricetes sp.]